MGKYKEISQFCHLPCHWSDSDHRSTLPVLLNLQLCLTQAGSGLAHEYKASVGNSSWLKEAFRSGPHRELPAAAWCIFGAPQMILTTRVPLLSPGEAALCRWPVARSSQFTGQEPRLLAQASSGSLSTLSGTCCQLPHSGQSG